MPSVWLIPAFLMAAAAFAGAIVVPYVFAFVIRRGKRTGCLLLGVVGTGGALIGLLLGAAVRLPLEAALVLPYAQSALEEQCGPNGETVSAAGYTNDPFIAWYGEDASCIFSGQALGWECYCDPGEQRRE